MKFFLAALIIVSNSVLFIHSVHADSKNNAVSSIQQASIVQQATPHVSMNIDIEISGLEAAAAQAAEGLELIGESLRDIADHPEISPQRQQQVELSLSRINELSQSLTVAVEQLPVTVEKSMAPMINVSNQLSGKIKQIIVIASIALILIILIALAAVYYFVLAPSTQAVVKTTKLLGELADTLESTANIVEVSSERNLQIMEEIQKVHKL